MADSWFRSLLIQEGVSFTGSGGAIEGSVDSTQIPVGSGPNQVTGSSNLNATIAPGSTQILLSASGAPAFAGASLSYITGALAEVGLSLNGTDSVQLADTGGGVGELLATASMNVVAPILEQNGIPVTLTIASGSQALATALIASGAKAATVSVAALGVLATDNLMADFSVDPTGTTGYAPSANGMLTIIKFCTTDNVNFIVVNNTGAGITPGAVTLNWRVVR